MRKLSQRRNLYCLTEEFREGTCIVLPRSSEKEPVLSYRGVQRRNLYCLTEEFREGTCIVLRRSSEKEPVLSYGGVQRRNLYCLTEEFREGTCIVSPRSSEKEPVLSHRGVQRRTQRTCSASAHVWFSGNTGETIIANSYHSTVHTSTPAYLPDLLFFSSGNKTISKRRSLI